MKFRLICKKTSFLIENLKMNHHKNVETSSRLKRDCPGFSRYEKFSWWLILLHEIRSCMTHTVWLIQYESYAAKILKHIVGTLINIFLGNKLREWITIIVCWILAINRFIQEMYRTIKLISFTWFIISTTPFNRGWLIYRDWPSLTAFEFCCRTF